MSYVVKSGAHWREVRFYRSLASRVPVRVPSLVAWRPDAVVLTYGGEPLRPPVPWVALATELGRLHRTPPADWLSFRPVPALNAAAWAALGRAPPAVPVASLDAALAALPVVLCHGDWHLGNLLREGRSGPIVWIDWADVALGHGPEDLALLWQRAEHAGLSPPRGAMLHAYARSRGLSADAVLHRAAVAAELKLLLLDWPGHLLRGPAPARARLLRRLARLEHSWSRVA